MKQDFSAKELSVILDITLQRVGQLAKEGVITKQANGRYLNSAITEYIRFLKSQKKEDDLRQLQIENMKERTKKIIKEREHREILIERTLNELIPMYEVRAMFARVFSAYRQSTREIEKRYGVEASTILIQAERSALRVEEEELDRLEQEALEKENDGNSGTASQPKRKAAVKSRNSRKKKS